MEYIKGNPFFALTENKIKQYAYLTKNIKTDILIIGGGIDGAILNYHLSKKFNVTLVDKERLGMCCTSAATALCEYQLDDYAENLSGVMTEEEVVDVYKMGLKSIRLMNDFILENGNECQFKLVPTLLFSNKKLSLKNLEKEFEFRKKHNFQVELFDQTDNPFPFAFEKALFCEDGGCTFNPYLFTKQLIEKSKNQGQIFENTKVDSIEKQGENFVVRTNFGEVIQAKKVILATGFNWEVVQRADLCERFTTFTIVTKSIKNLTIFKDALIQDDLDPYHYMRLLGDNRMMFGGEDVKFKEQMDEKVANKKYDKLLSDLKELLSRDDLEIDVKFCGSFGQTENNLGVISQSEDMKNMFYFISTGANGIINAFWGVDLLLDIMQGKENKFEKLFKISRQ